MLFFTFWFSSKAVLNEPILRFLYRLCNICTVRKNDLLLGLFAEEIQMRFLCHGILQVVVVIRKTGVGLELAHIVRFEDRRHRRAMIGQAAILLQIRANRPGIFTTTLPT